MISKKLLGEVLGYEIVKIEEHLWGEFDPCLRIIYKSEVEGALLLNIHELAHKCKEWAFNNGYAFKIEYIGKKDLNITLISIDTEKEVYCEDFYHDENCKSTFEPCEWIEEQLREKGIE